MRAVPDKSSETVSSSMYLDRSQLQNCAGPQRNTVFHLNGSATFGTSAPMRGNCGMPAAIHALDLTITPKVPSSGSIPEKQRGCASSSAAHSQWGSGRVILIRYERSDATDVGELELTVWRNSRSADGRLGQSLAQLDRLQCATETDRAIDRCGFRECSRDIRVRCCSSRTN